MGDAVNLASRLQSAAAPGKVLLSESTARLVRQTFELASLGKITVKDKTAAESCAALRRSGMSVAGRAGQPECQAA